MKKIIEIIFDFISETFIFFVFSMATVFAIACFYAFTNLTTMVLIFSVLLTISTRIINKFHKGDN